MKIYIQRRGKDTLDTIGEFNMYLEARAMLIEYQIADPSATYYLSQRACKAWYE